MRIPVCVFAALCAMVNMGLAAEAPPPVGFEAMEHLELLPCFFPPGTQTRHLGNYDMSGGNESGFRYWIRGEHTNGDWIIFDDVGPGCLYRQQMNVWHVTGPDKPAIDPKARIRYWFDGEDKPRLDMTFAELFGREQKYSAPFTPPLVFFDDRKDKDRFAICYYPFPFKQRLTITMTPQPLVAHKWFQYTSLKFPAGTPVETWKGPEADSAITRERWNKVGEDPKDASGNRTVEKAADGLAPGARATLLELNEPGVITGIRFAFAPVSEEAVAKTRLIMTWDGEERPAVDVPLGALVAVTAFDMSGYVWKKTYRALLQGYDGKAGTLYTYWPMPFWSKARIEVVNEGTQPLKTLAFTATWKSMSALKYPQDDAGHFHVVIKRDVSPPAAFFSTIAQMKKGRGRIVGQFFHTRNFDMDGDEFSYLDDSLTPQIHGSGSEDEHNQGWGGDAYDKPLWGGLMNGFQGGYRFYLNDSYLFDRTCRMTYEHHGRPKNVQTEGVIYAYLDPAGRAFRRLTDTLNVGDGASEAAHGFSIAGETWSGVTDSCYDVYCGSGKPDTTKDDGRAFTGEISFQAAIGKDNRGVVLRRRADRRQANLQEAEVLVDGAAVPQPWFFRELPAPPRTAWCDSEYAIPAAFTAGKERIAVTIRCKASDHPALWKKPLLDSLPPRTDAAKGNQAQGINAFHLWVYTLGPTAVEEAPDPPQSLAAETTGPDTIRLRWASYDDSVESFVVERCGVDESAFVEAAKTDARQNSAVVSGLKAGALYEFRVRGQNRFGVGQPATVLACTQTGAGGPNLLARAKASASSTWESNWGGAASAANDGKTETRWNSAQGQATDQWLAFELPEPARICAVLIQQETTWTRILSYRIQLLVDGTWKDVYAGAEMPDAALCRFAPTAATGVRILMERTSGNTPTIREVLAFCASEAPAR